MSIDRRLFLAGAAAMAAPAVAHAAIKAPGASPAQLAALNAIAAYLEAHRAYFGLPAMGLVVVDGAFSASLHSGSRDYQGQTPIAEDDLWEIGSISKSFIAACCLQLASEGRIDLAADIRTMLPDAPLSDDGPFTIQALLDHTTGLPDFARVYSGNGDKLWRGFAPGTHWSYSNTGYNLLGDMIALLDGRPMARSIETRICKPLGMAGMRGSISWRDRSRYPASYTPLRPDLPLGHSPALAPAPWVDAALGAGSVASTLPDMAKYLRFLIGIGQGKGGGIVTDAMARTWLANPVPQDPKTPTETYGLGLMHRIVGGRALLHHTGGMVCFSSSFHVDAAAGTGAFASCAVGMTGYRPRLLTQFATEAMRCASAGLPLPAAPALTPSPAKSADYAGSYGDFAVTADMAITNARGTAPLEPMASDQFITDHPDFADFALVFGRDSGTVNTVSHGSDRFTRAGHTAPLLPPTSPRITARTGRFQSDDPWIGGVTIVARGDKLMMNGTDAMHEIGNDVWRAADPAWSPERLRFGGFVDGKPQLAIISGRILERRDG